MEFDSFLRQYRKGKKLSVRKFAEILDVNQFRLQKWEQGVKPNYEDGAKIRNYFRVKDFENFSEDFLKTFVPMEKESEANELLRMKDLLIQEKDKRIERLEETINMLKESLGEYQTKKKS